MEAHRIVSRVKTSSSVCHLAPDVDVVSAPGGVGTLLIRRQLIPPHPVRCIPSAQMVVRRRPIDRTSPCQYWSFLQHAMLAEMKGRFDTWHASLVESWTREFEYYRLQIFTDPKASMACHDSVSF